jgi:hypothetical protein
MMIDWPLSGYCTSGKNTAECSDQSEAIGAHPWDGFDIRGNNYPPVGSCRQSRLVNCARTN